MSRYIVTKDDKITRTDTYLVKLERTDESVIEDLEPRRLFPMSNTDCYVTLLDSNEKEIALIKDLSEIDKNSRKAIEDCFFDFYMIPEIISVINVYDKFGTLKWKVETDRGIVDFSIRNRHSDIKLLDKKRLIIRDSDDNRYQLSDISKLDRVSYQKIYSYI